MQDLRQSNAKAERPWAIQGEAEGPQHALPDKKVLEEEDFGILAELQSVDETWIFNKQPMFSIQN